MAHHQADKYWKTFRLTKGDKTYYVEAGADKSVEDTEKALERVVKTAASFEESIDDVIEALNKFSSIQARKTSLREFEIGKGVVE